MEPSYQDFAEEEESSPLDLKVLVLYGLLRSKLWVVGLTTLGMFGGLLVGAASPNEYESEARLRYVPGERDMLTDDDLAGLQGGDRRNAAPGIADEIMLLENPLIYQRVAERLGASTILHVPDPAEDDTVNTPFHVRLMHHLQSALVSMNMSGIDDTSAKAHTAAWRRLKTSTTLVTVRNAATIRVMVRAYTPERAQQFCGALVDSFQERHREVFSAEARLEDQRQKVSDAREKYQRAEDDWNLYREQCGVFDYKIASAANQGAILGLNKLQDDREGERRKIVARIARYETRAGEIDEFIDIEIDPVVGPNPDLRALREQQSGLRNKILLLVEGSMAENQRLRRRKEIELQLEQVVAEIERTDPTTEFLPAHTVRQTNPEHTEIQKSLLELRSDFDGVIADIEYGTEKYKALADDRKRIVDCKGMHNAHESQVVKASADRDFQQDQLTKLEKLALAEMRGASALKPYWSPTLPLTKFGPSRLKPLVMGLGLGLMLGLGLAVLRQLLDRRLRYPETLEKSFGLRVIGVVPEVRLQQGPRTANGRSDA